jgi:hypothetical protein
MQIHTIFGVATLNQYAECVPHFIHAWSSRFPDADVRIILVANRIPRMMEPYRERIHLIPLDQLPPTITREDAARQLRYLFPPYYHAISPRVRQGLTDVVFVSNITMLPIYPEPFERAASLYPDDCFLQMLDATPPESPEPFPPRYTIATTETWLKLYGRSQEAPWSWDDVKANFNRSFNQVLLASPLYPEQTWVVGSGRVNYDPGVSDFTLQLPVSAYYDTWKKIYEFV